MGPDCFLLKDGGPRAKLQQVALWTERIGNANEMALAREHGEGTMHKKLCTLPMSQSQTILDLEKVELDIKDD